MGNTPIQDWLPNRGGVGYFCKNVIIYFNVHLNELRKSVSLLKFEIQI